MDLVAQRSPLLIVPISIIIPSPVDVVSNDICGGWFRITRPNGDTFKPGKVYITAKGAAGTTAVQFDIQISTNHGSSFSTALSAVLSLSTSVHYVDLTPTWTIADFHDGDLMRVDLTQVDAACFGVMIQIYPVIP